MFQLLRVIFRHFIVNLQYISSTQNMIYLLNFNITYIIIFATCFDSYESSSGINFKTYCTYCFTVFMSYNVLSKYCNRDHFLHYKTRVNVLSKYCNRDHFLHYKTRVNVYMVLGRGVWFCNAKRGPYCNSSTKKCKT